MTIVVPEWFIYILIAFLVMEVGLGVARLWMEYQLRKVKRRRRAQAATPA